MIPLDHVVDALEDLNDFEYDNIAKEILGLKAKSPAPAPQIIRSIETAHGRHADSIIMSDDGAVGHGREASEWDLPAVVVASGEHVRACREALEGETT